MAARGSVTWDAELTWDAEQGNGVGGLRPRLIPSWTGGARTIPADIARTPGSILRLYSSHLREVRYDARGWRGRHPPWRRHPPTRIPHTTLP